MAEGLWDSASSSTSNKPRRSPPKFNNRFANFLATCPSELGAAFLFPSPHRLGDPLVLVATRAFRVPSPEPVLLSTKRRLPPAPPTPLRLPFIPWARPKALRKERGALGQPLGSRPSPWLAAQQLPASCSLQEAHKPWGLAFSLSPHHLLLPQGMQ